MPEPLVSRDFLERLERLTLHWQKSFPGLVGGHNRSEFAGPGQEFLDHRNFHPGDDLRSVNWRAYMRFEKFFLKMFHIEPRVPVRLLIDASSSMDVRDSGAITKFDYARRLAAALIYFGLVQLDSIVIQPFTSALPQPFIATGGRHRFELAERFLRNLTAQGQTNFHEVAREYLRDYPQRGLTIIVSDFLDDRDCIKPLQYLADFGHELLLVQLWTEEDRSPLAGSVELCDAESGQRLLLDVDKRAAHEYTVAFDAYTETLRRFAMRNSGRHTGICTTTPLEEALFGELMLAARSA